MRRAISILGLLILHVAGASAQSSSASQTVELQLRPLIEIATTNSTSVLNANGSANDQFRVRSNKSFVVTVKALDGQSQTAKTNDLSFAMADAKGVGSANDKLSYESLSASTQDVILNGNRGADEVFSVNYKAKQKNKKATDYTVGVVYTATEL